MPGICAMFSCLKSNRDDTIGRHQSWSNIQPQQHEQTPRGLYSSRVGATKLRASHRIALSVSNPLGLSLRRSAPSTRDHWLNYLLLHRTNGVYEFTRIFSLHQIAHYHPSRTS